MLIAHFYGETSTVSRQIAKWQKVIGQDSPLGALSGELDRRLRKA